MALFDLPDKADIDALQMYQGLWGCACPTPSLTFGEWTDFHTDALEDLLVYESRLGDQPIPAGDGDIPFSRWAAGRFVSVPFIILGDADFGERRQEWLEAFNVNDSDPRWLAFKIPEAIWMIRARVSRRGVPLRSVGARSHSTEAVVELKLADPRLYDGEAWVKTAFVPIGTAEGGGFNLPANLPLNMTAASGGSVSAINNGTHAAHPLLRISNGAGSGDITNLIVTNETTGVQFEMQVTIGEGQTLTADFDAMVRREPGPHIYIDNASRFAEWVHPRTPLTLPPGTNLITSDVTGGAPTVRMDWLDPTL